MKSYLGMYRGMPDGLPIATISGDAVSIRNGRLSHGAGAPTIIRKIIRSRYVGTYIIKSKMRKHAVNKAGSFPRWTTKGDVCFVPAVVP